MPQYLVTVEVRKIYEVYIEAPDDTAIFEYKEKPHRLSKFDLLRIEGVELIGDLMESSQEVIEIIEGV